MDPEHLSIIEAVATARKARAAAAQKKKELDDAKAAYEAARDAYERAMAYADQRNNTLHKLIHPDQA